MSISQQLRSKKEKNVYSALISEVTGILNGQNLSKQSGKALYGENISTEEYHEFEVVNDNIQTSLQSMIEQMGLDRKTKFSQESINAASMAGVLAQDVGAYYNTPLTPKNKDSIDRYGNRVSVVASGAIASMTNGQAVGERMSMEAYDEKENRNMAAYSVIYNMMASRQDEFCETIFPTLVVSNDNAGVMVTVRVMMVYDAITRNINGQVTDYNKKNIIRAIVDPTILKNDATRIVPVVRPQNLAYFVDPLLIAPRTVTLDTGEAISTAPIKPGTTFDLMALSATDALIASGNLNQTDSLDPSIALGAIYVQIPNAGGTANDIISFNTKNQPFSYFNQNVQQNYRDMVLNFSTKSLMINKNTKTFSQTPLSVLNAIVTGDLIVRLSCNVTGTVNIERGDTTVYGNAVTVASVHDNTGANLSLTAGVGATIVALFANAKICGVDLVAYRTNLNRRQQGQLIDTTYFTQVYTVPLLAPMTGIRPVTVDGQDEAAELSSLVTAVNIRTNTQGVSALLNFVKVMSEYVDVRDMASEGPEVMGVGRYLVRPYYNYNKIDVATIVDSLKSHERRKDIREALISVIRQEVYQMYRNSEYKPAADAMNGGNSEPPLVVLATDPVIAEYLDIEGDTRTLGNGFNFKVVSTFNRDMAGKLIILFTTANPQLNGGPNPMCFGFMAWKTELAMNLQISRNNTVNKELTVQPSFLHVMNLPIMSVIDIINIPGVVNSKVALNQRIVL